LELGITGSFSKMQRILEKSTFHVPSVEALESVLDSLKKLETHLEMVLI
jgi:hypothetical protein